MLLTISGNRTPIQSREVVSYFNEAALDRSMQIANERYGAERSSVESDLRRALSSLPYFLIR